MSLPGAQHGVDVPEGLFKDVKYYLIGSIDDEITQLLDSGGAKRDAYLSEMVTHAIGDDPEADDYNEAKELFEIPVVTTRWVQLSVKCGTLLPTNAFMTDTKQLFHGVVACPSHLTLEDSKKVWAAITFFGGQCQLTLSKRCTHLITSKTSGLKYLCALKHPDTIKPVAPDWVFDSVSEKTVQDEVKYHPKWLLPETEATTNKSPVPAKSPPVSEQVTPNSAARPPSPSMQVTPVQFQPLSTPKSEGGSRTKEMLARIVNNRMQANKKEGPTIPRPTLTLGPLTPPATSPHPNVSPQGSRSNSPRNTLKNITNEAKSPGSRSPRAKSPGAPRSPRARTPKLPAGPMVNPMQLAPLQMPPGHMMPIQGPRIPLQQQQIPDLPLYFGHDPVENVPQDLCLLGCVFYITDYQKYLDISQLENWRKVIEQHGGAVDASYSNRITHLMCEHQKSDVFHMAVKDRKRVVTAHWLNDVLMVKKMGPPWMAIHVPSLYPDQKPCVEHIICVTNFEGDERTRIKHMISLVGAKYTGYMTHNNTVCISKKPAGHKYEKALEWRMAVVNVAWLNDILLGSLEALKLPINAKYRTFTSEDVFRIPPWRIAHLLEGWKSPLRIPKDVWKRFNPSLLLRQNQPLKRKADENELPPMKRQRMNNGPAPRGVPCVLITGIPKGHAEDMEKEIERLGGYIATYGKECTHLIARGIARTVKFLSAISTCWHIVTPDWVVQCKHENRFVDESRFALVDERVESTFKFSLRDSLIKRRLRPVFQDIKFHITPSTEPKVTLLREILESGGGLFVKKRPSVKTIKSHCDPQGNPTFLVITCENDLHLCRDLHQYGVGVYNAELILTGVLRQQLEYEPYKIE